MNRTVDPRLTRRAAIGKAAVAGAVVWSAPVLISSVAHATGSSGPAADGPIESMMLRFDGQSWLPTFGAGSAPDWYAPNTAMVMTISRFGSNDTKVVVPGQDFEISTGDKLIVNKLETSGPEGAVAPPDAETSDDVDSEPTTETTAPTTTEAPQPEPEPPATPATTQAPTTTAGPANRPARTTVTAPKPLPVLDDAPAEPVSIVFDWSADSALAEGDRVGPFQVVEITHDEA